MTAIRARSATKIYIAIEGEDMRKGLEGLFGLVRDEVNEMSQARPATHCSGR
jgi:hypothetical protein